MATTSYIEFYGKNCVSCEVIKPLIKQFAETKEVILVCVEDNPEVASKYRIMSVPALIKLEDGEPTGKFVGATAIQNFISSLN